MISLLAFGVIVTGPRVVEVPVIDCAKVVVQVFVKAPTTMSDREQAAWEILADALYDGTEEFSRDRLAQYGSQAGVPILIEAMPEYIRIQVVEPKGGLKVASQIVEAIVKRATLTSNSIGESMAHLRSRRRSVWDEALFELDAPIASVTPVIVKNLYAYAFRSDNITLVFGGDFEPGKGQEEAAERFKPWGARPPQRTRFDRLPRQRTKHRDKVSTFELRGTPISFTKADGAADLLAAFAVGVGKEGAMHRVLRNKLGWTYRQEVVLWPTLSGWLPRFVFANSSADLALGGAARDELLKDVETWDESRLARAKAMVETTISGENPLSPIWIGQAGSMGNEVEDKCAWTGLNTMMFGTPIELAAVVSNVAPVNLDELKSAAKKLLEQASVSVIPGF